jgi:hypothetical protein
MQVLLGIIYLNLVFYDLIISYLIKTLAFVIKKVGAYLKCRRNFLFRLFIL